VGKRRVIRRTRTAIERASKNRRVAQEMRGAAVPYVRGQGRGSAQSIAKAMTLYAALICHGKPGTATPGIRPPGKRGRREERMEDDEGR